MRTLIVLSLLCVASLSQAQYTSGYTGAQIDAAIGAVAAKIDSARAKVLMGDTATAVRNAVLKNADSTTIKNGVAATYVTKATVGDSVSARTNTSSRAGVVASGSGQNAKVWKTDASGVPGWRDDASEAAVVTDTTSMGFYNVLYYGAAGDGGSEGAGTADSAAFADAIAAASANGGGTVWVPMPSGAEGYKLFSGTSGGPIEIPDKVELKIDRGCYIFVPNGFTGTAFKMYGNRPGIYNAHLYECGPGAGDRLWTGIEIHSETYSGYTQNAIIRDCMFTFPGVGVYLHTTSDGWISYVNVENAVFNYAVSGIKTRTTRVGQCTFNNIRFQMYSNANDICLDSISCNESAFTQLYFMDVKDSNTAAVFASGSYGNYVQVCGRAPGLVDLGKRNTILSETGEGPWTPLGDGGTRWGAGSHLYLSSGQDAVALPGLDASYAILIRNQKQTNGQGTGVAFSNTGQNYVDNIGASIVFNRTGSASKGELRFYTKRTDGDTDAPTLGMTLTDAGNLSLGEGLIATGTTIDSIAVRSGNLSFKVGSTWYKAVPE